MKFFTSSQKIGSDFELCQCVSKKDAGQNIFMRQGQTIQMCTSGCIGLFKLMISIATKPLSTGRRILQLFLMILLSVMAQPLLAATYYVSQYGNDINLGMEKQPWATIQKAVNTLSAGDTVLIGPGTYSESVTMAGRSGQSGAPITIRASGNVVLAGSWNIGTSSAQSHYIIVDGVTFNSNLTIMGDYNIVQNCIFEGTSLGISWHPLSPKSTGDIVKGNIFRNSGKIVVMITGTNTSNILIEDNTWQNSEGDAIRMFGTGHVFRKNVVTGLNETGFHADIFQVYGNNSEQSNNMLIENNIFKDSTGSICMLEGTVSSNISNWIFRNNIWVNVTGVGQISIPYTKWYNNTFANSGTSTAGPLLFRNNGGAEYQSAHHTIIKNNFFIGCGSHSDGDNGWYHFVGDRSLFPGFEADYNYVTTTSAAGYGPKIGFFEPYGINGGDPEFVSYDGYDFNLQANSSAIDHGTSILGFSYDLEGTKRPSGSGWDIGALEFAGSNSLTPPMKLRIATNWTGMQ
ncbi:hypothetical protein C4565_05205 [Candidatus Parcubacteria bacterium]|nr:MAG: hypothetical protein C4565_05205 [Candidatus Parcubacteria bacterium]